MNGLGASYRDFFKTLTGFQPHPYQERVEERLRAGDSVIVRVPTGAGKTWAAVAPFLYSLKLDHRIVDRVLYALPLRSLASSLHAGVYEKVSGFLSPVFALGNGRKYDGKQCYCSLQIGGQKDDVFFESDLVFTTIDQLLSSYVFLPVSLPDRVGNINAGALIGSLVVLDEIHLLDASVALGTVIEMLDRLRGVCQFVLMTATASDKAVSWLSDRLRAVPVKVVDEEIRALPSQSTKRRKWHWSGDRVEGRAIVARHSGGRTIVLLNSVQRAQEVFLDLERHYEGRLDRPLVLLLHARFYPEDRKAVEDQLPDYFGPKATRTNVILVTTQVIEAGMDISADDLHSELAPMNSLIQRAGRTARYEHRPFGRVTVYEMAGLGPYQGEKALVDATRDILQCLPAEGRVVDFVDERAWIEIVHAKVEEGQLRPYGNLQSRRDQVHKAMDQGDRGRLSELVRDVDSVGVVITRDPETLFESATWPRLLGVSGYSLMRLRQYIDNQALGRWVAKGATEKDNERPGIALEWSVLSARQLRVQWLIAIHPDFASYDPRLGLRLGEGGPPPKPVFSERPPAQHYNYQFESWTEHRERIVERTGAMRSANLLGAKHLAEVYQVPEVWIEELVEITCALHDVGKLAADWQERAWRWQDDKDARARSAGRPVPGHPRVPIAHTWFESAMDWPFKGVCKFPPHAAEGSFAVRDALIAHLSAAGNEWWADLATRCAVTAIARHHGTRTRKCSLFRFPSGTAHIVADAIPGCSEFELLECTDVLTRDLFPALLLTFGSGDEQSWPLYAMLVRRLRLADQAATAVREVC